jgi:hypothetical protein
MALKDHYDASYGSWAGNPAGSKPDLKRCCASVFNNHRSHQCSKKNGHGPDGAYCKTHDPEAVARREAESRYNYHKRYYDDTVRGLRGADKVLKLIAEGHNDPRALAQEWLDNMGDKLVKPMPPVANVAPPPPPQKG